MTPADAAKFLELPADATPEQLEARFLELRRKLEDKIAKAPTPGLQAKYRESLTEITTAFETLILAADSSSLPVLQKQSAKGPPSPGYGATSEAPSDRGRKPEAGGQTPGAGAPPPREPRSQSPAPKPSARKSGREFVIVAVIAVAVLGAGGWWVLNTRAENAEKARVAAAAKADAEQKAAEAKAEAERKAAAEQAEKERLAALARDEAEARRQAEESQKERAAAEAERVNRLIAILRSQLAEMKILWSATEQTARTEERRVSELRTEERELERQGRRPAVARIRDELEAQEGFSRWLADTLLRHPVRIALVQAEELLSSRSPDEAQVVLERGRSELQQLESTIEQKRREAFTLTTTVAVAPEPAGVRWELTDAYGEVHRGQGAAEVRDLPYGPAAIRFQLAGFNDKQTEFAVARDLAKTLHVEFVAPRVSVESIPDGAEVLFNGRSQGVTPLTVDLPAPQKLAIELRRAGFRPVVWEDIQADEGATLSYVTLLINRSTPTLGFGFTRHSDQTLTISGTLPHSPAALAGLTEGDGIEAIHNGTEFVPVTALTNFAFLRLTAGKTGEHVRLQIKPKQASAIREVRLEWRPRGEIEDARLSAIHYVRGVVLLELNLNRRLEIAGKSFEVGEWNRATVRVAPGRHRLWLEGVGEYFVDVKPGEEIWVRGTMGGWKTLTKAEGEHIARKLHHTICSEAERPAPILP